MNKSNNEKRSKSNNKLNNVDNNEINSNNQALNDTYEIEKNLTKLYDASLADLRETSKNQ